MSRLGRAAKVAAGQVQPIGDRQPCWTVDIVRFGERGSVEDLMRKVELAALVVDDLGDGSANLCGHVASRLEGTGQHRETRLDACRVLVSSSTEVARSSKAATTVLGLASCSLSSPRLVSAAVGFSIVEFDASAS